jgi:hypothetical protein
MFSRHARALPKDLQDVQAATVQLRSVASAELTTPVHGYSGDMTRQDGIVTLGHVQCSRVIRQDDSTLLTPYKTSFTTTSH